MNNGLSNHDLRMFYSNERRLFALLIQVHHIDPTAAIYIIALWLFLEHAGRPNVVKNVLSSDDTRWVRLLLMEGESIIEYLRNPTAPCTTGIELTAGLARVELAIEEFGERRSEIVEFMNDVVAGGLRRAFADVHMLPDHALRYLTELVPLSHQPQRATQAGSGSGLFSHTRGRGLYPWSTSWTDPVPPPESVRDQETLRHDNIRRRSRSPGRPVGETEMLMQRPHSMEEHDRQAPYGGSLEAAAATQRRVQPFGRPIHTGRYDQEAGGSVRPRSPIRPTEMMPMPQLLQSSMSLPTRGYYVYCDPMLGWVAVPVGAGAVMPGPFYIPNGLLPVPNPLQAMGMRPGPEEYLTYFRGTGHGPQPMSPFQGTEQETVESEENDSHHQENSDLVVPQDAQGRILFVTFSRGFPIDPAVLQDYFTNEYGDIVETVIPEKVKNEGQEPMYARIVLKSDVFVHLVLRDQEKLMLKINGRDAWVRQYVKRSKPAGGGGHRRRPPHGRRDQGAA